MNLPSIPFPKSSVEIAGQAVEFRSLSRKEAYKLGTAFKDDPDAGEAYLIACGAGVSEEEATKWRDENAWHEVGKLVEGILYLTGLAADPKVTALKRSTNEPSSQENSISSTSS